VALGLWRIVPTFGGRVMTFGRFCYDCGPKEEVPS
jgi:hypothetical protein